MSEVAMNDGLGENRDDFYADLMVGHAGLSDEQSHAMNARLVLLLANEVGDTTRLRDLIMLARSYS